MTDILDRLKREALEATQGEWKADVTHDGEEHFVTGQWDIPTDADGQPWDDRPIVATADDGLHVADARHIARYDPKAVGEMLALLKKLHVVAARVSLVSDEEDDSTHGVETVALADECGDEYHDLLKRLATP